MSQKQSLTSNFCKSRSVVTTNFAFSRFYEISTVFKVLVFAPLYRAVISARFEFVKFFASRLVWSIPKFVAVVFFRCRIACGGVCGRVAVVDFHRVRCFPSLQVLRAGTMVERFTARMHVLGQAEPQFWGPAVHMSFSGTFG